MWSKSLTDNNAVINNYDLHTSYGASGQDLRNKFVVSYLYQLPETRSFGWFGREALDGWHENGITSFQSGNPFAVTSGVDTNLDGKTNDRVDVLFNPRASSGQTRAQKIKAYLNPAAFAIPTGPYGDEQANQFYGPGNVDTDLSVSKEFPITDNVRFQFRAEAFNAFRNANLNNPKTALSNLQTAYTS